MEVFLALEVAHSEAWPAAEHMEYCHRLRRLRWTWNTAPKQHSLQDVDAAVLGVLGFRARRRLQRHSPRCTRWHHHRPKLNVRRRRRHCKDLSKKAADHDHPMQLKRQGLQPISIILSHAETAPGMDYWAHWTGFSYDIFLTTQLTYSNALTRGCNRWSGTVTVHSRKPARLN